MEGLAVKLLLWACKWEARLKGSNRVFGRCSWQLYHHQGCLFSGFRISVCLIVMGWDDLQPGRDSFISSVGCKVNWVVCTSSVKGRGEGTAKAFMDGWEWTLSHPWQAQNKSQWVCGVLRALGIESFFIWGTWDGRKEMGVPVRQWTPHTPQQD